MSAGFVCRGWMDARGGRHACQDRWRPHCAGGRCGVCKERHRLARTSRDPWASLNDVRLPGDAEREERERVPPVIRAPATFAPVRQGKPQLTRGKMAITVDPRAKQLRLTVNAARVLGGAARIGGAVSPDGRVLRLWPLGEGDTGGMRLTGKHGSPQLSAAHLMEAIGLKTTTILVATVEDGALVAAL